MSFKDRMQQLTSPEELHELMHELQRFGSPNWTVESTRQFVPRELWDELEEYFDDQGRLGRWKGAATASTRATATERATAPADRTGPVPTAEQSARQERNRVPISTLISELHDRLAKARSGELDEVSKAPAATLEKGPVTALEDGAPIPERAPDPVRATTEARPPKPSPAQQPTPTATTSREPGDVECPICKGRFPTLDGRFRDSPMCTRCAEDMRREFSEK